MITFSSTLSGQYFTSDIPDLSFSIGGYRAQVSITVGGDTVYDEKLYPAGGSITLSELGLLLVGYARQLLVADIVANIREEDSDSNVIDTASVSFTVIYCEADLGTTAADFTTNHYLSILMGDKVTAPGRLEYLHYIGTEAASATAVYTDGSTAAFDLSPVAGNGNYQMIDVSPAQFNAAGKTLALYTVTAGNRQQQFTIDYDVPDCAPILIFENSFGVDEIIYCTGTHQVAPTYERSTMRQKGKLKNYNIEETRTFKADTGILTTAMANWVDELFRSQYVRVVNIYNGVATVGKEVVITESKSEFTNDDDALPRATFSYRYAQRVQNVIQLQRAGRIFDNTFDMTFN